MSPSSGPGQDGQPPGTGDGVDGSRSGGGSSGAHASLAQTQSHREASTPSSYSSARPSTAQSHTQSRADGTAASLPIPTTGLPSSGPSSAHDVASILANWPAIAVSSLSRITGRPLTGGMVSQLRPVSSLPPRASPATTPTSAPSSPDPLASPDEEHPAPLSNAAVTAAAVRSYAAARAQQAQVAELTKQAAALRQSVPDGVHRGEPVQQASAARKPISSGSEASSTSTNSKQAIPRSQSATILSSSSSSNAALGRSSQSSASAAGPHVANPPATSQHGPGQSGPSTSSSPAAPRPSRQPNQTPTTPSAAKTANKPIRENVPTLTSTISRPELKTNGDSSRQPGSMQKPGFTAARRNGSDPLLTVITHAQKANHPCAPSPLFQSQTEGQAAAKSSEAPRRVTDPGRPSAPGLANMSAASSRAGQQSNTPAPAKPSLGEARKAVDSHSIADLPISPHSYPAPKPPPSTVSTAKPTSSKQVIGHSTVNLGPAEAAKIRRATGAHLNPLDSKPRAKSTSQPRRSTTTPSSSGSSRAAPKSDPNNREPAREATTPPRKSIDSPKVSRPIMQPSRASLTIEPSTSPAPSQPPSRDGQGSITQQAVLKSRSSDVPRPPPTPTSPVAFTRPPNSSTSVTSAVTSDSDHAGPTMAPKLTANPAESRMSGPSKSQLKTYSSKHARSRDAAEPSRKGSGSVLTEVTKERQAITQSRDAGLASSSQPASEASTNPLKRAAPPSGTQAKPKKRQKRTAVRKSGLRSSEVVDPHAARMVPEIIDLTAVDDDDDALLVNSNAQLGYQVKLEPGASPPARLLVPEVGYGREPALQSEPVVQPKVDRERSDPALHVSIWEKAEQLARSIEKLQSFYDSDPGYVGSHDWFRSWSLAKDLCLARKTQEDRPLSVVSRLPFLSRNVRQGMGQVKRRMANPSLPSDLPLKAEHVSPGDQFQAFHDAWNAREGNVRTARSDRYLRLNLSDLRVIHPRKQVPTHIRPAIDQPDSMEICVSRPTATEYAELARYRVPLQDLRPSVKLERCVFRIQRAISWESGISIGLSFSKNGSKWYGLGDDPQAQVDLIDSHGNYVNDLGRIEFTSSSDGEPLPQRLVLATLPDWCNDPSMPLDPLPGRLIPAAGPLRSTRIQYEGMTKRHPGWRCAVCPDDLDYKDDAGLALHYAIVHAGEYWVEEIMPRDKNLTMELALLRLHRGSRPLSWATSEPIVNSDQLPYTSTGLAGPYMLNRVNQWTEWSSRIEPGTLADYMHALDSIWDGGKTRHVLTEHEENFIWSRSHLSNEERFVVCCWNRWVHQYGPVPVRGRFDYFVRFLHTYGSVMAIAGLGEEVRNTFHIYWRDRYLSLDQLLDLLDMWKRFRAQHRNDDVPMAAT
ncbi:hypothetical protein IAU60_003431 [Kwoniella sp. DSM 27419]